MDINICTYVHVYMSLIHTHIYKYIFIIGIIGNVYHVT